MFRKRPSEREFVRNLFKDYDGRMAAFYTEVKREHEARRQEVLGARPGQLVLFTDPPPST